MPTTNKWELLRFKTPNGTSILYTNKNKHLTPTGEMEEAYQKFNKNLNWKVVNRKRSPMRLAKEAIIRDNGAKCFSCQKPLPEEELTVEHFLSFSVGGNDHPHNLAVVCRECNVLLEKKPISEKIELIIQKRKPDGTLPMAKRIHKWLATKAHIRR